MAAPPRVFPLGRSAERTPSSSCFDILAAVVHEVEIIEQVMDEPTGRSIAQLREVLSALPTQGFFRLLTAMVQAGKIALIGEDGGSFVEWRAADILPAVFEWYSPTTRPSAV